MAVVWTSLIVLSVLVAAFNGHMAAVTQASLDSAKSAVESALGLVGAMTFWLGMMRIVQEAGLLSTIIRAIKPAIRRLFPDVPEDHPALQAIIMNIASNMLGLGNAATPFGLRAMAELDRLNPVPGVATNAMVLFLAINTSNVSIAPLGVIALRSSLGSQNAAGIWLPTLLATSLSTLVAIVSAKLLERVFPVTEAQHVARHREAPPADQADALIAPSRPTSPLGCMAALLTVALIGVGMVLTVARSDGDTATAIRALVSSWTLPVLIVVIVLYGMAKRVDLYDAMIQGAKEGFQVAVRIMPFLVAIMVAVGMFRSSGALDMIVAAVDPFTSAVGFPAAALPMALLRPFSGSGAYAVLAETMKTHGADTYVGYLVSTLQGSTETTFYVLAVYFGSVGITRYRHAVAAGLLADLAGIIGAILAVRLFLVSL